MTAPAVAPVRALTRCPACAALAALEAAYGERVRGDRGLGCSARRR
jgi:hypothetical protein